MIRLPIGTVRLKRPKSKMRVQDGILKCVGFLAEYIPGNDWNETADLVGTGFFIALPAVEGRNSIFVFVTARHTIEESKRQYMFVASQRGGGLCAFVGASERWFFHPTDSTADIAVMPINVADNPLPDIIGLSPERFLSPDRMKELNIGIGDEVLMPGLFVYAALG